MLRQPRLRFTETPGGWRSDGSAVSIIIASEQDAGHAVFRERPAAVIADMLDMFEAAAGQKK